MSADDDLDVLVADLVGVLRELERDLEPETVAGIPRPPTPRELARFTSEVAIPGAILVLRVNIEALRLLQRTLRMADGRTRDRAIGTPAIADRARSVSRASLSRLDDTLADLQAALEGRPEDAEARELLGRARDLRDEVDARLAASQAVVDGSTTDEVLANEDVPVDVEAELRSIKRAVGGSAESTDSAADTGGDGDKPNKGTGGRDDESDGGTGGDADDSE